MLTRNSSHSERSWSGRNGASAAEPELVAISSSSSANSSGSSRASASGASSNYSTPPPTLDAQHSRSASHAGEDENCQAADSPVLLPMISQNGISKPRRGPGRPKRLRAS